MTKLVSNNNWSDQIHTRQVCQRKDKYKDLFSESYRWDDLIWPMLTMQRGLMSRIETWLAKEAYNYHRVKREIN